MVCFEIALILHIIEYMFLVFFTLSRHKQAFCSLFALERVGSWQLYLPSLVTGRIRYRPDM